MNTQATETNDNSNSSSSPSIVSSPSNSISLIKLDELSSFGASKQSRLPALIKLGEDSGRQPSSMPAMTANQMEQSPAGSNSSQKEQTSLPNHLMLASQLVEKENAESLAGDDDFQVVNMESSDLVGPSLPQPQPQPQPQAQVEKASAADKQQPLQSSQLLNQQQQPSLLGDSLIDMIINLRNENQNLVRALETNNEYVKERLAEFKRLNEESKRREAQFELEKAEYEHQARKLRRQNSVLGERLKSMETKLKEMEAEVNEALGAASSSKASSIRGENNVYPDLNEMQLSSSSSSSSEAADEPLEEANQPTMQMDATNEELTKDPAEDVSRLSKEELRKRFDADKAEFYANADDPMKQCDRLEKQLNDIGKRDYEICLLQQQLNIYRQDFRLERMANLEAKLQIEKLKNDIDRLCYERLQKSGPGADQAETSPKQRRSSSHRAGVHFEPVVVAAGSVMSKFGSHLSKKAAKSAAKAAKYAAKQAHRDERAAAAMAAAGAATTSSASGPSHVPNYPPAGEHYQHHPGGRHHRHHHRHRGVGSEVVSDLLSTANKAMLTGYKMASTHVNLALDKLSQYEQAQASQLSQSRPTGASGKDRNAPSAPSMEPPSID